MAIKITVNGKQHELDVPADTPLLWVLRDHLQLTGTKYGCGMAQCGACTVHMNGKAMRTCILPVSAAQGAKIVTIEGLDSAQGKSVQKAWNDLNVVQCGYCQSGQIMAASALLADKPKPSDADIDAAMSGNICRCSTYARIRVAIHKAAGSLESKS